MSRSVICLFALAGASMAGESPADRKPPFHLEFGGYVNRVDRGYGTWQGADIQVRYSGFKFAAPFASAITQSRPNASQPSFGVGSYLFLHPHFYSIVSASYAPDRPMPVYPKYRYDVLGCFIVPKKTQLVLTTGYTQYQLKPGATRVLSAGAIYYYKRAVVSGGVNFNEVNPGKHRSQSGQFAFMYGREGQFWVGAGVNGGRVAYPSVASLPFDVRFDSIGSYVFARRWLRRNFGVLARYDFMQMLDAYQSNAINLGLFFDF